MLNAREKLEKQTRLSIIAKILTIIDNDIDEYEYLAKEYSKFDIPIGMRYREIADILREYKAEAKRDFDLINNEVYGERETKSSYYPGADDNGMISYTDAPYTK